MTYGHIYIAIAVIAAALIAIVFICCRWHERQTLGEHDEHAGSFLDRSG